MHRRVVGAAVAALVLIAGGVGVGFTATVGVSGAQTSTSSTTRPDCTVTFTPNPAPIGSSISGVVSGFDPDESVDVTITGLAPFIAQADAAGVYSFTDTATPDNAGKSFTYTFAGQSSGVSCTGTSTEEVASAPTNVVTVDQSVIGTAPANTTFTLLLSCDDSPGAPITSGVQFDATGHPQGTNRFSAPANTNCIVTQQGTAGATSWTYRCVYTPAADDPAGSGGACMSPSGNDVRFRDTLGASATITVVSTFGQPAAPPVKAGPTFTG